MNQAADSMDRPHRRRSCAGVAILAVAVLSIAPFASLSHAALLTTCDDPAPDAAEGDVIVVTVPAATEQAEPATRPHRPTTEPGDDRNLPFSRRFGWLFGLGGSSGGPGGASGGSTGGLAGVGVDPGLPGPGGRRWNDVKDPTPEEWKRVEDFMAENSPQRLGMLRKLETTLSDRPEVIASLHKRIYWRYDALTKLKGDKSDLYEFALRQLQIEDRIFGTLAELKSVADGSRERVETKLKGELQQFVDNFLTERQARVDKVRDYLKREEDALNRDRQRIAELMDRQRKNFEREMERVEKLDPAAAGAAPPTTAPTTQP